MYPSISLWRKNPDYEHYPLWGVRCEIPGDKRMRLNVLREEVAEYVEKNFSDGTRFNISPMIDQWAIFKGEVMEYCYQEPYGLCAYVNFQGNMEWRKALREFGKHYLGLQARLLLQSYMDEQSYRDVRNLLDIYPNHIVEFSVCNRSVGIIPGRNTVIWEVRLY